VCPTTSQAPAPPAGAGAQDSSSSSSSSIEAAAAAVSWLVVESGVHHVAAEPSFRLQAGVLGQLGTTVARRVGFAKPDFVMGGRPAGSSTAATDTSAPLPVVVAGVAQRSIVNLQAPASAGGLVVARVVAVEAEGFRVVLAAPGRLALYADWTVGHAFDPAYTAEVRHPHPHPHPHPHNAETTQARRRQIGAVVVA
jgi:hypothetical protein